MLFRKVEVDEEILIEGKPQCVNKFKEFKILLIKKCKRCRERKLCTYIEVDKYPNPFVPEDRKNYYCSECGKERRKYHETVLEFLQQEKQTANKKEEEKRRLAYLKGEVERREIEEKAKLYGITYPDDSN